MCRVILKALYNALLLFYQISYNWRKNDYTQRGGANDETSCGR